MSYQLVKPIDEAPSFISPDSSKVSTKFCDAANPIPAPNVFAPSNVCAAANVCDAANLEPSPNVLAPSKSCTPASKSLASPNVSFAAKSEPVPYSILAPEKS